MKKVPCVATDDLMAGFFQLTAEQADITVQFVMVADDAACRTPFILEICQ